MLTIEQVIARLENTVDRATLETYIAHSWIKPIANREIWYFEEIDIARVRLVHNLHEGMMVQGDAMDIVLSLLDQMYSHRERIRKVMKAIDRQPHEVQQKIFAVLEEE